MIFARRTAPMTYLSLLKIHFSPVAVEAIGPLAIIVVAIIVGAYFIGSGLRLR
jgi:hypothetical protein